MIYTVTLNPALDKTLVASGLAPDMINRAEVVRLDPGGKGINVSRALRNLGVQSVAMGFLGGATGQSLQESLQEIGLAADFCAVAGETRTNLTIHDRSRGALVKLNEAGPTVTESDIAALAARISARAQPGDWWVFSGNLPPGAPEDVYARLIALVQRAGGRAVLDASGEPLLLGVAAAPYLVKPNLTEAENLLGARLSEPQDYERALRALLDMGSGLAVISLGAEGALIADGRETLWARPPRVPARSNIGAGDSLLAGLLWGMITGWSLAEMIRWAVAAGTAAVLEEGTGVCSFGKVQELYPQITVHDLGAHKIVQDGEGKR
jgi:1-phosphofructokinase family hexose kinase